MSKRERVFAALRGERPDTVPVGFWGHNHARENSAVDLADETIARATTYDWDFVKVQSRSTCFDECWGGSWRASGQPTVGPTLVKPALTGGADLERLAATKPNLAPLQEQLEALKLVRRGLPDGRPILMTVFSPLMVLAHCFPEVPERRVSAVAALREDHDRAAGTLGAIAETVTWFAQACIAGGADGVFYATNVASAEFSTIDDVRRFQRPYDLRVLGAVSGAPVNVLHVCGEQIHFNEFVDYPVACFSWAAGDGNPSIAAGRQRTGKAVAGGVSARLRAMTPVDVETQARAAIVATNGAGLLLAASCSIDPDSPRENLLAAAIAARGNYGQGLGIS